MEQKLQTFEWPVFVFTCTVTTAVAAVTEATILKGKFNDTMHLCIIMQNSDRFLTPAPFPSLCLHFFAVVIIHRLHSCTTKIDQHMKRGGRESREHTQAIKYTTDTHAFVELLSTK